MVSYVPLGLAILFLKKKINNLQISLFFLIFFLFTGDIQWKLLQWHCRKEPCTLCLCAELILIPVPTGGEHQGGEEMLAWLKQGDGSLGRRVMLLALAFVWIKPSVYCLSAWVLTQIKWKSLFGAVGLLSLGTSEGFQQEVLSIKFLFEKKNLRRRKIRKIFKIDSGSKQLLFCTLAHAHMPLEHTHWWPCFFAIIQAMT